MHFLTGEEVARLVEAHPAHYRPLIITLAGTGMRWGEAVGLTRRRLDIMARTLYVFRTLEEVDGVLDVGTPKTKRSKRSISLPDAVVEALIPLSIGDEDGYLFTTPRGARLRRHNFGRRIWKPAVAEAKLPSTLRVHDLRHTHVAHLIAEGVHPASISRRLGHKSIRVTMDVYGHLLPDVDERVIKAANRALKPLGAPILPPSPADDQQPAKQ
jgi:integrase